MEDQRGGEKVNDDAMNVDEIRHVSFVAVRSTLILLPIIYRER